MNSITPFLWFDHDVRAVRDHYFSIFKDHEEISSIPWENGPIGITIRLNDLRLTLFNGGPAHQLDASVSLFVTCATQDEIDYYWERLTADGGEPIQCGWLKDKYGLRWQVVPEVLIRHMSGPDPDGAARTKQTMLNSVKFDIAEIERAYAGA